MPAQVESKHDPVHGAGLTRLAFEARRRAEAMGLIEPGDVGRLDGESVRRLAHTVQQAGIARAPGVELARVESLEAPGELAALLERMITALEDSPVPSFEWRSLGRIFEPETLATLLRISVSSLRRYQQATRRTPDEVAARLHFLALVVGDLAGAYNEIGIRRWFQRKRRLLDGRSPAQLLSGGWAPEDPRPMQVRRLARALASLSAT